MPPRSSKPPASKALGEFGRRVRAGRESLGLSQEQLAEDTQMHWSYLGRVERGQTNPSLLAVLRISKLLGIGIDELVRGLEAD